MKFLPVLLITVVPS